MINLKTASVVAGVLLVFPRIVEAEDERYGSFVDRERPIYLECSSLVPGQPFEIEVRNLPTDKGRVYLGFSTAKTPQSLNGFDGTFGPDLSQGGLISVGAGGLQGVVPSGIADFHVYVQALVTTPRGGRFSSMLELRRGSAPTNRDPVFPLKLLTQELLPLQKAGWDRSGAPVRVGVPLPRGTVFAPNGEPELTVLGPTPAAQFTTLAKWPDDSVKWALVEYLADVDAGQISHAYWVDHGNGGYGGAALGNQSGRRVTVDTGALQFVIDGDTPELFESLEHAGEDFLAPGSENRLFLVDRNDHGWTYHPTDARLVTNGTVRAEVQVDGVFTRGSQSDDDDRVYVRCLIEATRGQQDVRVQVSLRNTSIHFPENFLFRGFGYSGRIEGSGTWNLRAPSPTLEGSGWIVHTSSIGPGQWASLTQGFVKGEDKQSWLTEDHNDSPYTPFLERLADDEFAIEGIQLRVAGTDQWDRGDGSGFSQQHRYADVLFLEATDPVEQRGLMIVMEDAKYCWPERIQLGGSGFFAAELFPLKTQSDAHHYPLTWGTSETRSFILRPYSAVTPDLRGTACRHDYPVEARAALWVYNQSKVWPWQLASPLDFETFAADAGLPVPKEPLIEPMRTIYRFANATGGYNNRWNSTRFFMDWLRTGDGGAYFRARSEALYKADKMPFTLDDGPIQGAPDVVNESEATKHGKFYDGSKHTFFQSVADIGFARGERALLDSAPHFARTLLDDEITSSRPGGSYVPGTYGAVVAAGVAILQIEPHPELEQHLHDIMTQWACMVFKHPDSAHVDTTTKGWQAAPDEPVGSPLNPDGYFVTRANGKPDDWVHYGYTTQYWVDGRLGPLAYLLYAHHLEEHDPTNPTLAFVKSRADDWYHFARRALPDDHCDGTGDQFTHDVFLGDGNDENPDPYEFPGDELGFPSSTGYVLHPLINFHLEQEDSSSAMSYGVELARSMSRAQWDKQSSDPTLCDFVIRYLRYRGLR